MPVIFSFGKFVFIFSLYLFKLISSSISPPNISFNVIFELFFIFGPFISRFIFGIFPLISILGLLIFTFTFGIFPFILCLLIFPPRLNSGKFILGPFISILPVDNFPSITPDIL